VNPTSSRLLRQAVALDLVDGLVRTSRIALGRGRDRAMAGGARRGQHCAANRSTRTPRAALRRWPSRGLFLASTNAFKIELGKRTLVPPCRVGRSAGLMPDGEFDMANAAAPTPQANMGEPASGSTRT